MKIIIILYFLFLLGSIRMNQSFRACPAGQQLSGTCIPEWLCDSFRSYRSRHANGFARNGNARHRPSEFFCGHPSTASSRNRIQVVDSSVQTDLCQSADLLTAWRGTSGGAAPRKTQ